MEVRGVAFLTHVRERKGPSRAADRPDWVILTPGVQTGGCSALGAAADPLAVSVVISR
jgi:hypothetical protein